MEFAHYEAATEATAVFGDWSPRDQRNYVGLGLVNEAGEVAGELKKLMRDDGSHLTPERRQAVISECGDVLWYLARTLEQVGADLDQAAMANIKKVLRRHANGTVGGSGER